MDDAGNVTVRLVDVGEGARLAAAKARANQKVYWRGEEMDLSVVPEADRPYVLTANSLLIGDRWKHDPRFMEALEETFEISYDGEMDLGEFHTGWITNRITQEHHDAVLADAIAATLKREAAKQAAAQRVGGPPGQ